MKNWYRFIPTLRSHERIFALVMLLFFTLFYTLQIINHRFDLNDFRVYYGAAHSFIHGKQIYGVAYGLSSGLFKYAPVTLLLFAPAALLPFWMAATFHFIFLSIAFTTVILYLSRMIADSFPGIHAKRIIWLPYLLTIASITHIYRELHLGNINAMLLLGFGVMLHYAINRRDHRAGLFWGILVLLKPHFLLLALPFVLRGRLKTLLTASLVVATGLLLPIIVAGIGKTITIHQEWIQTMLIHNASPVSGTNTLYFAIIQFLELLGTFSPSPHFVHTVLLITLGIVSLFVARNRISEKMNPAINPQRVQIMEFLFVLALIPNLTITDTEHFMFSIPLTGYLLAGILSAGKTDWLPWAALPAFVFYGGNIYELTGRTLSDLMAAHGILGIGNLLLILLAYFHFNQKYRKLNLLAFHSELLREQKQKTIESNAMFTMQQSTNR